MEHQLSFLIQKLTKKIPYLKMDKESLDEYIINFNFYAFYGHHPTLEDFLNYVSFSISIEDIPEPYKQKIKEVLPSAHSSPISIDLKYSKNVGLFYHPSVSIVKYDETLIRWLEEKNYPYLRSLDLKWNFMDKTSRDSELFKIYLFAKQELKKIEETLSPVFQELELHTNKLLAEFLEQEKSNVNLKSSLKTHQIG